MNEILDKSFDSEFSKIENLTWYPWVGKDYKDGKRKILVIGESHYNNDKDDIEGEKKERENPQNTREYLYESLVPDEKGNKLFIRTYSNLMETLCDRGILPNNKTALSRISFYNFIQRHMDYSKELDKERPKDDDYKTAWTCFLGVIDILKPTDCIFLGVESTTLFEEMMGELQHTDIEELEKVGRVYPRITSIKRNSINDIPIVFIQHPGARGFSPTKWYEFLRLQLPEAMNWLNRK